MPPGTKGFGAGRLAFFLVMAFFVGMSAAAAKYVAVVETEVDAQSGAAASAKADIRQVTAEIRRQAVKNLPRDKYSIMTSETVMAQGGATLVECAEENCVIALGSKIGADYIVRGIVSKLGAKLTLEAVMYETENGTLVASSDLVRAEKFEGLVENAATACAEMFKKFVNEQVSAPAPAPTPVPAVQYPYNVTAPPATATGNYNYAPPATTANTYSYNYARPAVENFTAGERWGTWFLNWLVPGLGSATVMKDWKGFGWQLGLAGLGYTLLGVGIGGLESGGSEEDAIAAMAIGEILLITNFTYNIVRSIRYDKPGGRDNGGTVDWYFAPKYQFPVGMPVSWGGFNMEGGVVWGNGAFFGLDFNFGYSSVGYDSDSSYSGNYTDGMFIGGGLNMGNVYDFGNQLQLVYGGSVGLWYGGERKNTGNQYDSYYYNYSSGYYYTRDYENYYYDTYNFLAPFVKLRWRFLELTYRGLLGVWEESRYGYRNNSSYSEYDDGFSWNSHQLMLGFYFETSNRRR
jgi:TolB-like protein